MSKTKRYFEEEMYLLVHSKEYQDQKLQENLEKEQLELKSKKSKTKK